MPKAKSTSGSLVFGWTGAVCGLGGAGDLRASARFPRSFAATQAYDAPAATLCRRSAGADALYEAQFGRYSQVGRSIDVSEQSINASASQTIVEGRDCQYASAKAIAVESAHVRASRDQNAARSGAVISPSMFFGLRPSESAALCLAVESRSAVRAA